MAFSSRSDAARNKKSGSGEDYERCPADEKLNLSPHGKPVSPRFGSRDPEMNSSRRSLASRATSANFEKFIEEIACCQSIHSSEAYFKMLVNIFLRYGKFVLATEGDYQLALFTLKEVKAEVAKRKMNPEFNPSPEIATVEIDLDSLIHATEVLTMPLTIAELERCVDAKKTETERCDDIVDFLSRYSLSRFNENLLEYMEIMAKDKRYAQIAGQIEKLYNLMYQTFLRLEKTSQNFAKYRLTFGFIAMVMGDETQSAESYYLTILTLLQHKQIATAQTLFKRALESSILFSPQQFDEMTQKFIQVDSQHFQNAVKMADDLISATAPLSSTGYMLSVTPPQTVAPVNTESELDPEETAMLEDAKRLSLELQNTAASQTSDDAVMDPIDEQEALEKAIRMSLLH